MLCKNVHRHFIKHMLIANLHKRNVNRKKIMNFTGIISPLLGKNGNIYLHNALVCLEHIFDHSKNIVEEILTAFA